MPLDHESLPIRRFGAAPFIPLRESLVGGFTKRLHDAHEGGLSVHGYTMGTRRSPVERGDVDEKRWGTPPGMLTDLYELTMAQGYLAAGLGDVDACFHLSFRTNPFGGGYAVACGLQQAIEFLAGLSFGEEDLRFLKGMKGNDAERLFGDEFLDSLARMRFTCDVDAIPEGTPVFPHEPLVRVMGPIAQCQLVETALLTIINFQTLVATKAARVCQAAQGDPVVEFGLRRAQGPDGGVSASRAAFVGGCTGTSNTLAARVHGIPAVGTHAHSWVMAFDDEMQAFNAYAKAMPNNCTLLVDTYDTLDGVRNATRVAASLRESGHRLIGVRIDSGDLAWLSVRAREILDEAGLHDALVVASNELDEYLIESLKEQGARIDLWGVGTKLATAFDQPALGGVYKLSAIRRPGQDWVGRVKLSEQTAKVTVPGIHGCRRYVVNEALTGDLIYDIRTPPDGDVVMVDPADPLHRKELSAETPWRELLVPVFRSGECVYEPPPLRAVRETCRFELASLDPSLKRFLNPHTYPVGLERGLHEDRIEAIRLARGIPGERT